MNKTILKILICSLILLIGIGAVSAIEDNSTGRVLAVEQAGEISSIESNNSVISVSENISDVLSAENNDVVISVSENNSAVLSAENNDTVISVSENYSEVLGSENNNTIISISNDDLTSYSPFAQDPQMTQSKTQYKTLYLGKLTFSKKYKSMVLNGYKIPSKKNKKAWNKHKSYQKTYKKQFKKFKKTALKAMKNAAANHWHAMGDTYYKIKYSGKYMYIKFYFDCYRTYNYNPLLNKSWWD